MTTKTLLSNKLKEDWLAADARAFAGWKKANATRKEAALLMQLADDAFAAWREAKRNEMQEAQS